MSLDNHASELNNHLEGFSIRNVRYTFDNRNKNSNNDNVSGWMDGGERGGGEGGIEVTRGGGGCL